MVGKRQHLLSVVVTGKFAGDVFIVSPVDEVVVGRLVLGDAHFGTNIAHHFKVVAIEVVGSDVEQHGNVGTEVVHIVELERGDFQYIPIAVAFFFDFSYLKCERTTDVSGQSYVESGRLEDVEDERCCGGFAVGACDAEHLGVGVARCEFEFGENGDVFLT